MERICPHGIGHPDPDDMTEDTVHGVTGAAPHQEAAMDKPVRFEA